MPRFAIRYVFLAAFFLLLAGCLSDPPAPASSPADTSGDGRARAVLDSARAAAGADVLARGAVLSFAFRGDRYRLHRSPDSVAYQRTYRDTLGRSVEDRLANGVLRRRRDDQTIPLADSARRSAVTAVNSVAYFALLPFPLGDAAVQPRYAGADTVGGTPYHRVAVTFHQNGGGRDWQDRFLYWFDARDYSMDYLAYAFGMGPDEAYGTRFREAFNVRRPGGIRVADYRNYTTPDSLSPDALTRYGTLFERDTLRLVSTVALDSVRVRALDSARP